MRTPALTAILGLCLAVPLVLAENAPRLFPIWEQRKTGYMTSSGSVVIQPQFDAGTEFSEGLASVRVGDKWGCIDEAGAMVIAPQFDQMLEFSEGLAPVLRLDIPLRIGNVGYVDRRGHWVIPPRFYSGLKFVDGLAAVTVLRWGLGLQELSHSNTPIIGLHQRTGYIDRTGAYVVKPKFIRGTTFSEGMAEAVSFGWRGYIDTKGRRVMSVPHRSRHRFSGGLAAVWHEGGKFGYLDREGRWAIEPTLALAGEFSERLAPAAQEEDDGFGYLDRSGAWIIPPQPQFRRAHEFHEGMAAIQIRPSDPLAREFEYGYIDRSGQVVIPARFVAAGAFSGGLALVWEQLATGRRIAGYINKAGEYIWKQHESN
jgi:hypothetical protein